MISLLHLNKLIVFIVFFITLILSSALAEDDPANIWEDGENQSKENVTLTNEESATIESPIIVRDENKKVIQINEDKIEENVRSVVGIFDPQENNFNLNMWLKTDGEDIKKVLKRINKLKLSKPSEDLLFQVLFTNAYAPLKNLNAEEFLKIKVNWLIKRKRINNLETLLKNNPEVGKNSKAVKFLVNEYLSSADIKFACDKIDSLDLNVGNKYLEKFSIYCLINNDQKEEAQLIYDLLKENGFKDKFFEDKVNFLLGITSTTSQKILDNNLLNFYLSYITSGNFQYQPTDKTNNYIWRFLSSVDLIRIDDLENEEILLMYEQAAAQNSFEKDEIFKIYLKMNFDFNQLISAEKIYKNLPNYKARALIYQSMLLSNNIEKKINLAFLLKELFIKDEILNIYTEELSNILKSIDSDKIPEDYYELVKKNLKGNLVKKIKFDNDILHRSKVIKHFLENNNEINKTEKDFKSVYKKIKKNKKYFISIKDIVVLESLAADGIILPEDLDYVELSSQLSIPKSLQELAEENQLGLVMLKIVEIIGEDNISDLDPETIYFLNKILNVLNLKKIRNNILSEALPVKV